MNQQRTRPKSASVNNSGPNNRRIPQSAGQAAEKNSGSRIKNTNKPTSPSQNKSNRNLRNNAGKKIPPRKQQRKSYLHNFELPVTPLYLYDTTPPSPSQICQPRYYFSRPSNMDFHDFTKRQKPPKNLRSLLGLGLKFIPTPSLMNSWSRLKKILI